MDEWTGEPDRRELDAMRRFIAFTAAIAQKNCCDDCGCKPEAGRSAV